MKIPENNMNDGGEVRDYQASIREANERTNRARQEAEVLRARLEKLEGMLSDTKVKLVEANAQLADRDQRLKNVQSEAAILNQSVNKLEARFANLKKLQEEASFCLISQASNVVSLYR